MDAEVHTPNESLELADGVRVEFVIWIVPHPLKGSAHRFKYRMALVADDVCVLRYDNESGKGDHRHVGTREFAYDFRDPGQLTVDFWTEVGEWMTKHGR
jgi:hypothetical protein